jgi:16S rRNA (cytosine967-C5)-methyltransferase
MALSIARKIAYDVLLRVEAEGAYASDVLHIRLGAQIKPADAALATEITMGVLRSRRFLDSLLDPLLKKPVAQLDLPVAIALRMGLYQLRYLQRVPPSAAVNESVNLVKMARKASAAPLVNAVLRRAAALPAKNTVLYGAGAAKAPAKMRGIANNSPADQLGILHSHPTWMVERWLARFGEERTIGLLEANNRSPRLTLALHDENPRDEIIDSLRKSGLQVESGQLLKSAIAVSAGSPARTTAFQSGAISIQDEASQVIPLLLDVNAGDSVLDVCAAPGGKTATLVRAAGQQGIVVAADLHAHRLGAMRSQFQRLKIGNLNFVKLNATRELPFRAAFQRILVDAPCSGTGTLSRHPEIRWRLRPEQLAEFHRLQVDILINAIAMLAPQGRLVYSTCSVEPEENEDVVGEALQKSAPLQLRQVTSDSAAVSLKDHLIPGVDARELFDAEAQFRTVPGERATDGFFAAILERP